MGMEYPGKENSGTVEVWHTFLSQVMDVIALEMTEEYPAAAAVASLSHTGIKLSNSSNSFSSCASGGIQGMRPSLLCSLLSPYKTNVL